MRECEENVGVEGVEEAAEWARHFSRLVLNRAGARMTIFEKEGDYEAFERVLEEAVERYGTRLLAYALMPNIGTWSFGRRRTANGRGSSAG